jgi:hypothetical protein
MALVHDSFILAANTPLLIATIPAGNPTTVVTITNANAAAILLGDATLGTANTVNRGIRVDTLTNQNVSLNAGDQLYAVSTAGTGSSYDVAVLYSKVIG